MAARYRRRARRHAGRRSSAAARRGRASTGRHDRLLARLVRGARLRGAVEGRRAPERARPEAPRLRAAAVTTSLPEALGGERNWDYRYCWIRDTSFTLNAFLELGCGPEAQAYFWWLMQASQLTHPRLRVLYRLDGGAHAPERAVALDGYRGS